MMTSQILKSVEYTKTQKSRYLNETNKKIIFWQKKFINYTLKGTFMAKNSFVAEVTVA